MKREDAEPLKSPRLSLAAAARIRDELTSTDEHNNTRFRATGALHASDISGAMYEVATVLELLAICEEILKAETNDP